MKRFIFALLILVVLISMVGCAKLVKTERMTVDVEVVDAYHRAAWTQPLIVGKVISVITHPATYRIDVKYEDFEYAISGSETYNAYKDRIGETVPGILEIMTFDDGTVKYNIVGLGEE